MITRRSTSVRVRVVAALAAASVCWAVASPKTLPAAEAGQLARQVEIRRTGYGVPHIKGETLEAAAFGLGYCQAEDHLLNIMQSILRARGELAKHFGGDKNVETDFWNRQYEVHHRATATYHRLDADFRSMLEGFAAGLNYYVSLHPDEVPAWVPTVNGHDMAAHGLTGIARFAFNRRKIVDEFIENQQTRVTALQPPKHAQHDEGEPRGSNMWSLAPSRTESGHAILLGNPHQAWSQVATYYEAHLTVPGQLNFYGSTFVGRPVLTTGWNENLGWSHTVNYPDLEEIYELDVDADRADHYVFDDSSIPLRKQIATVEVQTEEGLKTQSRVFWYSPLGPVVHRTEKKIYVLKSAAYDEFRFYQQWLRMAQAQDFTEFRRALEIQAIPMFNICYADREGNIFYLWNGTVPDLPHEAHKSEAVPARASSDVWTRFHAIDELPQLLNPPGGYVQNCNSPPFFTSLQAPLDPSEFPAHYPANNVSLRSQHSLQLIDNDQKFTLEQIRDLKHSPKMLLADRVKDDLIEAVRREHSQAEVAAALEMLESWDHTVSADSRGGTLFAHWWKLYSKDKIGGYAVPWTAEEPTSTPRGLDKPARAVECFLAAIEECKSRYGRWDVSWGDVHRIRMGDVDLPMSGGSGLMGCFRVAKFRTDESDSKQIVNSGDSWVFAVEFGAQPRAYTIVGYSQSEVEGTPHFSDQASLYSNNTMKRAAFTEVEINKQLLKRYHPGEE